MPNSAPPVVVVLGTGGTIAGVAASAVDAVNYRAGLHTVAQLSALLPVLPARVEAEQVVQIDSKDMNAAVWQRLATRVAYHLDRHDVAGIVITHGTDTLEETAYFLHRVLGPAKPVVLTAAMRPATALLPDGPQNLHDAVVVAQSGGARGVVVVMAGRVHGAIDVRKLHSYRLDAFGSGEAGTLALIEEGHLRCLRPWPMESGVGLARVQRPVDEWPRVEIVTSHAGADGLLVQLLVDSGVRGLVVAGTGNGTVHEDLEQALHDAAVVHGLWVMRSTRCADGSVVGSPPGTLPSAGSLSAPKARIELLLQLLSE